MKSNPHRLMLFSTDPSSSFGKNEDTLYPDYKNIEFIKRDTLESFMLNGNNKFMYKSQMMAGVCLMTVCRENHDLLKLWLHACEQEDYKLVSDAESEMSEHPDFKGHRHDQALLNCILERQEVNPALASYYDIRPGFPTNGGSLQWSHISNSPILAKRDTQRYFTDAIRVKGKRLLFEVMHKAN